jgi:hypothetical protein
MTSELDVDAASKNLVRYLNSCVSEMEMVAQSLGRTSLSDISKSDLCTTESEIARATGLQWGFVAPEMQHEALEETPFFVPGYLSELDKQNNLETLS